MTAPDDERDFSRSVAITSSIYPDPDTHIEIVTYGDGGDAMSGLFTADDRAGHAADPAAASGSAAMLRHPLRTLRMLWSRPAGRGAR